MPSPLNVDNFEQFIRENGQVSFKQATRYADIGDKIIKLAMTSQSKEAFETAMAKLQKENEDVITKGYHSVSNMASCLLYAQSRDNFKLRQGYGKGSNINQYGDPATSERTVANLMEYFSKERKDKEYGYDAGSTHGQWRDSSKKLPDSIKNLKLRIDIDSDPTTGSIPAPLKGIHTAHFVPGVDSTGVPKLLVKPENWGMSKLLHKIMHALDFILTRFQAQNVKGLEGRQETKLTKEVAVTESYAALKEELKTNINQLTDKPLKDLFKGISSDLDGMKKKGFDKPTEVLKGIQSRLNSWIEKNPEHKDLKAVESFRNSVHEKMTSMVKRRDEKYSSESQKFSEVRLNYQVDREVRVDSKPTEDFKSQLAMAKKDSGEPEERIGMQNQ